MIDEGQFGAAMVQSPFNYRKGYVYGTEASSTYKQGPRHSTAISPGN